MKHVSRKRGRESGNRPLMNVAKDLFYRMVKYLKTAATEHR